MKKRKLLTMLVLLTMVCLFVHAGFRAGGHDNVASPSREVLRARTLRIVIDPGHGGTDVGAIGASGRYEKDFNLMLAHKVVALLEQEPGIEVYMTRTDDRFLSQTSRFRPAFANELGADLLISIHGNTYSDPAVTGTETFYYHVHSRALANIVQRHVVQATGFRDRGFMRGDLFVLAEADMPGVLVEVGYLSNPRDEALMWTDEFQWRVAAAILSAVKEYAATGPFSDAVESFHGAPCERRVTHEKSGSDDAPAGLARCSEAWVDMPIVFTS